MGLEEGNETMLKGGVFLRIQIVSSMNRRRDPKLFYQMICFSCSTAERPFWRLGHNERGSEKGGKMVYKQNDWGSKSDTAT